MASFWQNAGNVWSGLGQAAGGWLTGNTAGAAAGWNQAMGAGAAAGQQAGNWFAGNDENGGLFGNGVNPGLLGLTPFTVDPSVASLPGYEQHQKDLLAAYQAAGNRQGPQLNTGNQAQFRQGQADLAAQLQAQAAGQGPSLAQGQLRSGTDRNLAQAYAMAQSTPGNAGAIRSVANQRAAMGQQAAGDAAQMRMMEQMQAQNQLGQVLAGARGQDIGLASEQANLGMQQQGLNDAAQRYYMGAGLSLDEAQRQAAMQMQMLKMQAYNHGAAQNQQIASGLGQTAMFFAGV